MPHSDPLQVLKRTDANRSAILALLELLGRSQRFLVTSHARPDGDALGSALGLMHALDGLGKQVVVAFSDPVPSIYKWLPGVERIQAELPNDAPEVVILLECESLQRTGFSVEQFEQMGMGTLVNIDHHRSGQHFAVMNWIDPEASAVGAMVYDLAVALKVDITPAMASCLYAAVLTDTGSFTFPGTVAGTFALAEHLVVRGANPTKIAAEVFFSNPQAKVRALGIALQTLKVVDGVAWGWILQEGMDRADAEVEDCEGIVNYLIGIVDVKAAAFLREMPGGAQFRLSLRSKGDVDVARVAEKFGGGGHRNASGCTLDGPLEAAITRIVLELRREKH